MKKELVELSIKHNFESKFHFSYTDENYYYFWMCELMQWLREIKFIEIELYSISGLDFPKLYTSLITYNDKIVRTKDKKRYNDAFECSLIEALKLL